jgi:copper resistance protein B
MAAARAQLRREHGDVRWRQVGLETAEVAPADDLVEWEARASWGGDINRLVIKSEGEASSGDLEHAEAQVLYSRAIGPYFDIHAGLRQDFEPRPRTWAVVGVDGLAPYWFDVGAALFLSDRGRLAARLEGSTDFRITQRWVLQPRLEANFSSERHHCREIGSGLTDVELGLRLAYAVRPTLSPYVGLVWERAVGETADLARAHGEAVEDSRFVVGLRGWF